MDVSHENIASWEIYSTISTCLVIITVCVLMFYKDMCLLATICVLPNYHTVKGKTGLEKRTEKIYGAKVETIMILNKQNR